MSEEITALVESYLDKYCKEKGYQVNKSQINGSIKYEISNRIEKIPLILYNSGKFVPGGSPKLKLRREFDDLKTQVSDDPDILTKVEELKVKSCSQKYVIILEDVKKGIKDKLQEVDGNFTIEENPKDYQDYRIKIAREKMSLTVTQFSNDTLLLQGKEDILFNEVCDIVERIGTPSEKEVVARFLSHDEEKLKQFTNSCTPELLTTAENNVKIVLQDAYLFIEPHDQKWYIAAECLRIANIPLPEYSPIVMPASKAFEGFAKKLLLKVGFYPPTHFNKKEDGFINLKDKNYSGRINLISKEKYAGTYIEKLSLALDMTRNFMMHSDNSAVTKVKSAEEANDKLAEILKNTKELFDYFNKSEFGGLYP